MSEFPVEHRIRFGTLNEDGTVSEERLIRQADVRACAHFILLPEHYRENGTCRCDDPEAGEMLLAGYVWRDGRWR
jgi:hypothetical protein